MGNMKPSATCPNKKLISEYIFIVFDERAR